MTHGRLFVSFWNVCLTNLPEGLFTRRRFTPQEARLAIEQAREGKALLCVTANDLVAPYHERERKNHEELCQVLGERYGIELSLRDFVSKAEDDPEGIYCINPLDCVKVAGLNRLLVVTCLYMPGERSSAEHPSFRIDPATIEFHVITATEKSTEPLGSP